MTTPAPLPPPLPPLPSLLHPLPLRPEGCLPSTVTNSTQTRNHYPVVLIIFLSRQNVIRTRAIKCWSVKLGGVGESDLLWGRENYNCCCCWSRGMHKELPNDLIPCAYVCMCVCVCYVCVCVCVCVCVREYASPYELHCLSIHGVRRLGLQRPLLHGFATFHEGQKGLCVPEPLCSWALKINRHR